MTISGDRLAVYAGNERVVLSASMLPIIDRFRAPLCLREAVALLPAATKLDWMQTSTSILRLHAAGILVGEGAPIAGQEHGFASAAIHVKMLDDRVRTEAYLRAIRSVVRPGDVVVDLGTGTGVLAIAAVKAGARQVYAIERTSIGEAARAMFDANGAGDRITLVRGNSTQVSLPERADVLVSEIIGNDPFGEQVLTYTRDALRRFMKERARMVPSGLRLLACGVSLPPALRRKHVFDSESARTWSEAYGIDFSPLARVQADRPFFISMSSEDGQQLRRLGPESTLIEIDLSSPPETVECSAELGVERDDELNGVATWFEVPSLGISTSPWDENRAQSWRSVVWVLPRSGLVRAGEVVRIRYRFTGLESSVEVGGSA